GSSIRLGLARLMYMRQGGAIQCRGPSGHNLEKGSRVCVDLLKAKIKNGPGFGEFREDYESILARIAQSQVE
ncbi:hypothetical protein H4582DRAFT_1820773, partial [Lactarius indigo]